MLSLRIWPEKVKFPDARLLARPNENVVFDGLSFNRAWLIAEVCPEFVSAARGAGRSRDAKLERRGARIRNR